MNAIRFIWNTITTLLISFMVILAVLLWGFRFFGYEAFIVQSGSMEPNYPVGSLVYVKPVDAALLKMGDVITFEMEGNIRGTHRIIEVVQENGHPTFITKGDANESRDANPVLPEDIVGQVKFAIPQLGYLVTYIQNPPGTYITISVAAVLLLMTILPDVLFPEPKSKKRREVTQ